MNDKLKFDILQLASKYYLTKQIPDNWYNLNEEEQNKYLSENVWQPFEYHNPDYIWDQIENAASATEEFVNNQLVGFSVGSFPPKTRRIFAAPEIHLVWTIDDVLKIAQERDLKLSKNKVLEVLKSLKDNHDRCYGISWDTVSDTIDFCL
ncbi:MAG: hypothetical protein RLZZ574_1103 [Cyanobacteriota bacterium]|jgi:hypothetical protein